jgi:hypothetical protein
MGPFDRRAGPGKKRDAIILRLPQVRRTRMMASDRIPGDEATAAARQR